MVWQLLQPWSMTSRLPRSSELSVGRQLLEGGQFVGAWLHALEGGDSCSFAGGGGSSGTMLLVRELTQVAGQVVGLLRLQQHVRHAAAGIDGERILQVGRQLLRRRLAAEAGDRPAGERGASDPVARPRASYARRLASGLM